MAKKNVKTLAAVALAIAGAMAAPLCSDASVRVPNTPPPSRQESRVAAFGARPSADACAAPSPAMGEGCASPSPFDIFPGEDTLPIMAWYSIVPGFASKERFEELKDAGFNLSFTEGQLSDGEAMRVLDFASTVGMKCLFMSKNLQSAPEKVVPLVKNHPALAGYSLKDEPGENEFPRLGDLCRRIRALDPNHFCYLNLLPDYGVERNGLSYTNHIRKAASMVPTEFLSYDQYGIIRNKQTGEFGLLPTYYRNLETVAYESRRLNKPFWAFALSTPYGSRPIPDMAQLRFQMYNNLAYGAQGLQYFTYWYPNAEKSPFHAAPIGAGHRRSAIYERVRELNAEIQRRAFVFKNSTVLWTRHAGAKPPRGTTRLEKLPPFVETLDTKGRNAVVSLLAKGSRRFLVIVNGSYREPLDLDIRFSGEVRRIRRDGTSADAWAYEEAYSIDPGDCEIFEAVEPTPLWRRKGILPELEWNGKASDPEPAEKADFLPAGLAEEPQPDARVAYVGGLPKISLNGNLVDPIINMSDVNYKYSLNQGRKMQAMGVTLNQIIFRKFDFEAKPGVYDFSRMDVYMRRMLKYVPEARVVATIELELPKWTLAHPEAQIAYADGPAEGINTDDHKGRAVRPSSASPEYRAEVRHFFEELGKYVAAQPWGKRIVAVRPSWGIYKEWHVYGMYHGPDCGPAMTAAFRRYKNGLYANEEVPTMDERTVKDEPFFFNPDEHRKLVDYYECLANETADLMIETAQAVKKSLPGRLVGAYYGYVLAVHPPEGANVLVDKVLASGAVDFMSNPAMYTAASRRAGGAYYARAIPETFRRHGKLMLIEDDMRHYLIAPFTPGHKKITTADPREAEATTRRNMLNTWFDGCGIQFLDCNSRREERIYTHDAPEILQAICDVRDLGPTLGPRPEDSGNRTAVVVDWRQRFLRPSNTPGAHIAVYVGAIEGYYASGVPADLMTLDDFLAKPDGRYDSAVFLNVFSASGETKERLRRRVGAKGFKARWFLKSALGAAADDVLAKVPTSGGEWRGLLTSLGSPAFSPPGNYVRRHGDRMMFHTGKAGRWTLTPAGYGGAHEVFSGRDYVGSSFEIETDGPGTFMFLLRRKSQ